MNKAIHIENTGKNVERVLSIIEEEDIAFNPTGLEYLLITDYEEPPTLNNPMAINYAMYDKINKAFKWVQVRYQNTATEELLGIENLKAADTLLQNELAEAIENINLLIELQADTLGGAI